MSVRYQSPNPWSGREDHEEGLAALRFHQRVVDNSPVAMIGFACEVGVGRNQGRLGAKEGPYALRSALANIAAPSNANPFSDLGTIEVSSEAMEEGQTVLGTKIAQALKHHSRVVVIGGGHETAYGSYLGLSAAFPGRRIGIINLDAHLDLRKLGRYGSSSGTPFYQIRELSPDRFDYLCMGVAAESNTQALFDRAKDWGVRIVYDKVLNDDLGKGFSEIEEIVSRNDMIYLTIDLDVLPATQAPGVSAPAVRGVPFVTVEALIERVLLSCSVAQKQLPVADLVELSPRYDVDSLTARTAASLIWPLLI